MKKNHVDDWFKYLRSQQYTGGKTKREMTLGELAAKLSGGTGDGGKR